jgi:hypothetical protein
LATLIAIPWVVIPRLTWMPIEPILRAPSPREEGTVARPTGVPCGPGSPEGTGASGPDAGQPVEDLGRDAVVAERGDHHPLEPAHVGGDVVAVGRQVDDRIGHQLPGAVVGDPSAAVGLGHLDALHPVPVLAHPELGGVGSAALRIDRMVLEQQQQVGHDACRAGFAQLALGGGDLVVGPRPEPDDPEAWLAGIGCVHGLSLAGGPFDPCRTPGRA